LKVGGLNWKLAKKSLFLSKRHRFAFKKKKKRGKNQATRRPVLFTVFPAELPEWPTSRRVCCLVWPPNPTRHAPTCPPGTHLSWGVVRSGQKGLEQLRFFAQIVHLGQSANLAVRGAHFEPTVWITQGESRAGTFFPLKTRLPSVRPYK